MASKTEEDVRLSRYLLGELSERERERLEEAYFADDDAFEQTLIAEDELIDSYVRGELSAEERQRFEKLFLSSPRGRERVLFSRALTDAVSAMQPAGTTSETRHSSWRALFASMRARNLAWRFALTALALIVAIGLSWLLVERVRMRDELARARDERIALAERVQRMEQQSAAEQQRSKELLTQLENERARTSPQGGPPADNAVRQNDPSQDKGSGQAMPPSIITFVLTPGLVRGGEAKTLIVPRGTSALMLRLNSEAGSYNSYRAVIETVDGRQVWSAASIKMRRPSGREGAISLPALPAKVLRAGDYVLRLSGERPDGGFEGVADYSFRVVRK